MNQSGLNDIRNNGYIRYDGDIYNYKYEKVHSIHDEILQICNKDSNPDLWEIMSKHGNHYKCMKALSQMDWVYWWKNYDRRTPLVHYISTTTISTTRPHQEKENTSTFKLWTRS